MGVLLVLEVIFLASSPPVSDPHSIVEFAVDLVTLPDTSFRYRRRLSGDPGLPRHHMTNERAQFPFLENDLDFCQCWS